MGEVGRGLPEGTENMSERTDEMANALAAELVRLRAIEERAEAVLAGCEANKAFANEAHVGGVLRFVLRGDD